MRESVKKRRNVTCTVQDTNDLNALRYGPIKNHVVANGKATKFVRKVGAFPSHFRHTCQELALFTDRIKPGISGDWTLFCNPESNFSEVEVRETGSQDNRHQLLLLLSRLRTLSLRLWMSNGATSPRPACSIPRAISRRSSSWRKCCTSLDSPSQRYNSHRSSIESCSVADLTSATVLIKTK